MHAVYNLLSFGAAGLPAGSLRSQGSGVHRLLLAVLDLLLGKPGPHVVCVFLCKWEGSCLRTFEFQDIILANQECIGKTDTDYISKTDPDTDGSQRLP